MSKKCPYCGSYNTDPVYSNYVGRAAINVGRGILAGGATIVGSLINRSTGSKLGLETWKNTDPGEFHGSVCNNCKKEF